MQAVGYWLCLDFWQSEQQLKIPVNAQALPQLSPKHRLQCR